MHDYDILKLIVTVVAKAAGLKQEKRLYEMARYPTLSKLRDTALYLIRKRTKLSFPEIGKAFHRDHSTILVAVKREETRLGRPLPKRPDGRTLKEWHDHLLAQVDAAIAEVTKTTNLPN